MRKIRKGGSALKRIVLTGGGTAGHVTPNLALIPSLLSEGWDVHYVGTADGIEKRLVEPLKGVTYHAVLTGKLRRYFDPQELRRPIQGGCGRGPVGHADDEAEARPGVREGRLRVRAGRLRRGVIAHPGASARERHDARPRQQTGDTVREEAVMHLPGGGETRGRQRAVRGDAATLRTLQGLPRKGLESCLASGTTGRF